MSLGEVDTLNLLSDKLNNLFDESQDYYESFLDANNLYKKGKLTDKEFFQKTRRLCCCIFRIRIFINQSYF